MPGQKVSNELYHLKFLHPCETAAHAQMLFGTLEGVALPGRSAIAYPVLVIQNSYIPLELGYHRIAADIAEAKAVLHGAHPILPKMVKWEGHVKPNRVGNPTEVRSHWRVSEACRLRNASSRRIKLRCA